MLSRNGSLEGDLGPIGDSMLLLIYKVSNQVNVLDLAHLFSAVVARGVFDVFLMTVYER